MADNFPIDIDYKKVNDWMYDRKKLAKDWAAKLKAISLKVSDIFAKSTIADASIKKMMKDNEEKPNYLALSKILNKVLETDEAKAKNMFGSYTSKNVSDLVAIKKLYEKDNLQVADMAKIMAQNAAFEIPAVKKNITAFENQIQELFQEEQTYKNSIANSEKEFANYCEKLGIPGENIHQEVPALTKHLPSIFNNFTEAIKASLFREILDYYYNFTRYINPKQNEETLKLPILEHLNTQGDDLYELYQLVKDGKEVSSSLAKENERKYSRYSDDQSALKDSYQYFPQIIDLGASQSGGGAIDWSDFEVLGQSTVMEDKKNPEDSGFEIIDDKPKPVEEVEVVNKDTILSNFDARNQMLANLSELSFFIQQRINESGSTAGNTILQAYEQGENSTIFEVSRDKMTTMLNHINNAVEILSNFKARQYFILKEQPKASERIINNLNQYKANANKARDNFSGLSKRNYDINKAIQENKTIQDDLTKQTAELKSAIEAEMKKIIKRDVFIIGDIHKIISKK